MKKFTDKINELHIVRDDNFDKEQLKMGIKVESEHGDVYEKLDSYLETWNIQMPWSKTEFYQKIAEAHLREMPDYYTRLSKMELDK